MPEYNNQGFRGFTNTVAAADQPRRIIQFIPRTAWSTAVVTGFDAATGTNAIPLHFVIGLHPSSPTAFAPGVEFQEVSLSADLATTLLLPLASDRNPVFASARLLTPPLGGAPFWVALWDGAALASRPTNIQYNVWAARRAGT